MMSLPVRFTIKGIPLHRAGPHLFKPFLFTEILRDPLPDIAIRRSAFRQCQGLTDEPSATAGECDVFLLEVPNPTIPRPTRSEIPTGVYTYTDSRSETAPDVIALVPTSAITQNNPNFPVPRLGRLGILSSAVVCVPIALGPDMAVAAERVYEKRSVQPSAVAPADPPVTQEEGADGQADQTGTVDQPETQQILPDSIFAAVAGRKVIIVFNDGNTAHGELAAFDSKSVTIITLTGRVVAVSRARIASVRMPMPTTSSSSLHVPRDTSIQDPTPTPTQLVPGSISEFHGRLDNAHDDARAGFNWRAYRQYEIAFQLATSDAERTLVIDEMEDLDSKMRRIGRALWITGTVLNGVGLLILIYPPFWYYGGVAVNAVGIGMIVPGAVMHSRANQVERKAKKLKRRSLGRIQWNGGLSWSF